MLDYWTFRKRQQDEVNAFPIGFAFSNEQFEEMKLKLNVKSNDELCKIPYGGFIRKSDKEAFRKMMGRHAREREEYLAVPEQLKDAFECEMANHEFGYAYDYEAVVSALGFTMDEVFGNEERSRIFDEAKREYLARCE